MGAPPGVAGRPLRPPSCTVEQSRSPGRETDGMLRRGRREQRQPAAARTPLLRELWWRARDYEAAVRWIVAGVVRPGSPEELARPDAPVVGPPIVLVPGVYESWQFLRPLGRRLNAHGLRVHALPELGINRRSVESMAADLGFALAARDLRDVVLVAHSKGGLVGKRAMTHEDPDGRITSMISVNTPFAGSRHARWFLWGAVSSLVPTNDQIRALRDDLSVDERILAVQSFWDPHIPGGGALDHARNVELEMPGHFRPLEDAALEALIVQHTLG